MKIERVDELPVIISVLEKSGLSDCVDSYFSTHGNWTGESYGKILVCFLCYVLSSNDHRLSPVEEWFIGRQETLRHLLSCPDLSRTDVTDDRLGHLLSVLSDDQLWHQFENSLNKSLIAVHRLEVTEPIRLDASIAQSFQKEDELFKMGFSKQHRIDLPQLKIMLGVIDPIALPLLSIIVEGNTADDVLYEPLERQIADNLEEKGLLFVGDSKMSGSQNRAYLQTSGHYYLCPLSERQCSKKELKRYLGLEKECQSLWENTGGKPQLRAKAFEIEELISEKESATNWLERRIVVYSPKYAKSQTEKFAQRLERAKQELAEMLKARQGKKIPPELAEVERKVSEILKKYQVTECLEVQIEELSKEPEKRKYGGKVRTESGKKYQIKVAENEPAITQAKEIMSTRKAIECYRKEYRIEAKFNELLNKVTALLPIFLQKNERIRALVKVLLLAIKFTSIIQYQVRENLKKANESVTQVYPGNPKRETKEPTIGMILRAFREITLVTVEEHGVIITKITKLKPIQLKLLELMELKSSIYENLNQISFSSQRFSET
jgi:transposase